MWPATAGVVTSGTGVAINLATDGSGNPWAWVAVVLLTALGVVVALRVQPVTPETAPTPVAPAPATTTAPEATPEPAAKPERPRYVSNKHSDATVNGILIQAGYIDKINSPTTINQNAVAREGGTIHQAGRDVNPNP
ncbi:hypothetical protein ALI22I_18850 [Saccharothrix sp. ALI-22-I]|nr:hypothetical protein ALI22I_18850 [Saccharothrix sp. ALI-22-I]